jgi:ribonuclease HII
MAKDRLPTLGELRRRHVALGRPLPLALARALEGDARPGAKALLDAIARRRQGNRSEGQRLRKMLRFETALWTTGITRIAGVDEAGMSPLAGPVAAAACILPVGARLVGVDDSKALTAAARERLAEVIRTSAIAWAVAYAEPEEIDRLNIYWASILAMRRAVAALAIAPEHLLIDARRIREIPLPQERIVHGDARSLSIAAASILAKTARDARMDAYDAEYPGYGFSQHKGYPVKAHKQALVRLGACPLHRRSFAPVRVALGLPPLPPWPGPEERGGSPSSSTERCAW